MPTSDFLSSHSLDILGAIITFIFAAFKVWEARNARVAKIAGIVETGAEYAFKAAESIAAVSNNPTLKKGVEAEKWFRKYLSGRGVTVSQDMIEGALVIWESLHGDVKTQDKANAATAKAAAAAYATSTESPPAAVTDAKQQEDLAGAVVGKANEMKSQIKQALQDAKQEEK